MDVFTSIKGNIYSEKWHKRLSGADIEYIYLDQWSAQKSRFITVSERGKEYAIALKRNTHFMDGDIIDYSEAQDRAVVIRIKLNDVMVVDMKELTEKPISEALRYAVELGHAIGNQHWPAIVKNDLVYIPLTVDKKVMSSVMNTHHIDGISFSFQGGNQVLPYLAPHEVRRLFGAADQSNHTHHTQHSDYE